MVRPVTTTDVLLAEISGKLDELLGVLRPGASAQPEPQPEPQTEPTADEPTTKVDGAAKPTKKAAAKKTAAKRSTRRRVDGT